MEMSLILLNQVTVVFILIVLGYILTKFKMLNDVTVRKLSEILLMIVTPSIVINAFQKEFEVRILKNLIIAAGLAVVVHLIGIIASYIFLKKDEKGSYKVSRFSVVYSNCGYMGLPLLSAVLGSDGVFYGSAYVVVFTVLSWTQGVYTYTGDKKQLSLKKTILNPGVLGTLIGLFMFFINFRLPSVISQAVVHMANMNTPLAMLILGKYMTEVDFKKILKNFEIYKISLLKLIFIPAVFLVILKFINIDDTVAKAILISASCPVATAATLFANRYESDARFASEVVAITTLFSVITIPLVVLFL